MLMPSPPRRKAARYAGLKGCHGVGECGVWWLDWLCKLFWRERKEVFPIAQVFPQPSLALHVEIQPTPQLLGRSMGLLPKSFRRWRRGEGSGGMYSFVKYLVTEAFEQFGRFAGYRCTLLDVFNIILCPSTWLQFLPSVACSSKSSFVPALDSNFSLVLHVLRNHPLSQHLTPISPLFYTFFEIILCRNTWLQFLPCFTCSWKSSFLPTIPIDPIPGSCLLYMFFNPPTLPGWWWLQCGVQSYETWQWTTRWNRSWDSCCQTTQVFWRSC